MSDSDKHSRQVSLRYTFLAIALWFPACLLPMYFRSGHVNILVGVYLAITGVLAAACALRRDPLAREKAAWVVLLTILTYSEIRNLYTADAALVNRFDAIDSQLKTITSSQAELIILQGQMKVETNPVAIKKLEAKAQEILQRMESLKIPDSKQTLTPPAIQTPQAPTQIPTTDRVITSVPRIFQDGNIIGKNLGDANNYEVFVHFRIKTPPQKGYYSSEAVGGGTDRLISSFDPLNNIKLPRDYITSWTDTTIKVRIPQSFWDGKLAQMIKFAEDNGIEPPPSKDNLEVGYTVALIGAGPVMGFSGYFYHQDAKQ